ncbi:HPP family protein [Shewanella woodyi]|uniref:HPP family protein n=1 Tax=Shewanella woodyi TaxID=60961 RepID=UPI003F8D4638
MSEGATAVTVVIGGSSVHELGYYFILVPVFLNAIILLSIPIKKESNLLSLTAQYSLIKHAHYPQKT